MGNNCCKKDYRKGEANKCSRNYSNKATTKNEEECSYGKFLLFGQQNLEKKKHLMLLKQGKNAWFVFYLTRKKRT